MRTLYKDTNALLELIRIIMRAFLLLVAISSAFGAPSTRLSPRITGGHAATRGQFPYQVSYQWGILGLDEHVCGASIISPTWVVTAGHCVTEVPELGDHRIMAGIVKFTDSNPVFVKVVQKIVHPKFGGDVGPYDIALLRLEKALEFTDVIQPIALPKANTEITGNAVLSGWGSISTITLPIMPITLQTVDVVVLDNEECDGTVEKLLEADEINPFDRNSNICTGPLTGGISACSGDSGGPLAKDETLIGIVSWGMLPCGAKGAPSVYTKVSNYIDFIREYVTDLPA